MIVKVLLKKKSIVQCFSLASIFEAGPLTVVVNVMQENMRHAFSNGLCKAAELDSKPARDIRTGKLYKSIWQAAKEKDIAYSTCKNSLRGRRKTRTDLLYQAANLTEILIDTSPIFHISV